MKGVLVVLDGMADLPCRQLGDKTPLEAAHMPNLDFLAARGEVGYMYTVRQGFVPESDEAIVSMFGNDLMNSSRGQLEAKGADVKTVRGDLALRVDFATIDNPKSGKIIDRRAARTLTTYEAEMLAKAINNKVKIPCDFVFKATVQYRGVLVLRGGLSDNFSGNDLTYAGNSAIPQEKIAPFKVLDEEDNTQYTVNILKEFMEQVFDILDKHEINENRRKKGLLPANYLLVRGQGAEIPKLKLYPKWMSVSYMPLEKGIAKLSGMENFGFEYPKLKTMDAYANLREGLAKACENAISILKKKHKDFDYAFVHLKETDVPGHDNKPLEKKEMLEHVDKTLFKFLADFAPVNKIQVAVTADHSTPCKLKNHSADPVPVMLYNLLPPKKRFGFSSLFGRSKDQLEKEVKGIKFCEKTVMTGTLGKIEGKDFLEKIGFLK